MKNLQPLIVQAIEVVRGDLLQQGAVPAEMNGYISSFSASVINSGLLPTLVFYSHKGGSQSDRPMIVAALSRLVAFIKSEPGFQLLDKVQELYEGEVMDEEISRLRDQVFDAAIALKMAIRVFPKGESKKESV